MSLLSLIGISNAVAATAPATAEAHKTGGWISTIIMLVLFVAVFYFLLVRPQSKRAKEHRKLLSEVSEGDEVLTSGGMVGKVSRIKDNYVVVVLSKGVEITMQKSAIANVLPKGTMDSID